MQLFPLLTPAGSDTEIQYNNGGVFGGDSTFTFDDTNKIVNLNGKWTSGTQASPQDVTATRQYGAEFHYSGNNYDVTGIRSRAQLVTTDTTATALGGLFQAANNDNIDSGVLMGFMAEAIGKSTANASTITTMRGGLIGTEWGAFDTITNLKTLHIRGHSRNAAGAGSFGTGYGVYLENEAVGGNGQAYDAGIYFKGTNLSGGNSAYTYGIDFTGGTYGTAEMLIGNAKIGSSTNDLVIQPVTDSATFFQVKDSASTKILTINSTTANCELYKEITGASGNQYLLTLIGNHGSGDLAPGDGSGILFKVPVDSGTNSIGASIVAVRRSVTDTSSLTDLEFRTSGNDESLDTYMLLDYQGWLGLGVTPERVFHMRDDAASIRIDRIATVPFVIMTRMATGYGSVVQSWGFGGAGTNDFQVSDMGTAVSGAGTSRLTVKATTGFVGFNETAPETHLEMTGSTPYVTLHNDTHEDTDGGRESLIQFFGEQSGGEETTLAKILVQHDGAADDQKGLIALYTNDGSDGDSPTLRITIDSVGATDVVGDFTAGTIQADNGFTGTGAYSNFTIVGGVITAAS